MHSMWTIVSDVPIAWCVCQSLVRLHHAKTAELIKVLFGVETTGGPRNIVLDGVPITLCGWGWGKVCLLFC